MGRRDAEDGQTAIGPGHRLRRIERLSLGPTGQVITNAEDYSTGSSQEP